MYGCVIPSSDGVSCVKASLRGTGWGCSSSDGSIRGGLKCQDDEDVSFCTYYHDQLSCFPDPIVWNMSPSLCARWTGEVGANVDMYTNEGH